MVMTNGRLRASVPFSQLATLQHRCGSMPVAEPVDAFQNPSSSLSSRGLRGDRGKRGEGRGGNGVLFVAGCYFRVTVQALQWFSCQAGPGLCGSWSRRNTSRTRVYIGVQVIIIQGEG